MSRSDGLSLKPRLKKHQVLAGSWKTHAIFGPTCSKVVVPNCWVSKWCDDSFSTSFSNARLTSKRQWWADISPVKLGLSKRLECFESICCPNIGWCTAKNDQPPSICEALDCSWKKDTNLNQKPGKTKDLALPYNFQYMADWFTTKTICDLFEIDSDVHPRSHF